MRLICHAARFPKYSQSDTCLGQIQKRMFGNSWLDDTSENYWLLSNLSNCDCPFLQISVKSKEFHLPTSYNVLYGSRRFPDRWGGEESSLIRVAEIHAGEDGWLEHWCLSTYRVIGNNYSGNEGYQKTRQLVELSWVFDLWNAEAMYRLITPVDLGIISFLLWSFLITHSIEGNILRQYVITGSD